MKNINEEKTLFCQSESAQSEYILHSPSKFARSSLIYLQETGTLQAARPYTTGRSGLDSFLFFQVLSGSGMLVYEDTSYNLNAGDCVFIDCRNTYSQICSSDLWTLRWVHFNGAVMENIYQKYREHGGNPMFSTTQGEAYQQILDQIRSLVGDSSYITNMALARELTSLLTLLMQETRQPIQEQRKSTRKLSVSRVKEYLDQHYAEQISLDKLSEAFFIDKYYLTKVFKAQYDMTINNYLNEVRIRKAKELLRFSDLAIEQIGVQVGIGDANYFARVFKRVEGTSPSAYRALW